MDGPARDAALGRMLAPEAGAQTRAAVVGDPALLDRVRKAASTSGSLRAVVRNLPVAYRVEAFSDARARVSVWSTAVWSIASVAHHVCQLGCIDRDRNALRADAGSFAAWRAISARASVTTLQARRR